jgi:hypothetical protein
MAFRFYGKGIWRLISQGNPNISGVVAEAAIVKSESVSLKRRLQVQKIKPQKRGIQSVMPLRTVVQFHAFVEGGKGGWLQGVSVYDPPSAV